MKIRYRFHPSEYELGENEKLYSGMEARGWRLVKRGRYLSKFVPVEPTRTRYRVEVSFPAFLEESGLSEGQLAVFEDCGWEYVDSQGFLHIFRAPEGSGAPEFYADPRQQAATLKKVRRDLLWWGWGALAFAALAGLLWAVLYPDSVASLGWKQVRRFVEVPEFFVFLLSLLLLVLFQMIWDTWRIERTYSRLRRGVPLDHDPQGRRLFPLLVRRGLALLMAMSAMSFAVQAAVFREKPLPVEPEGPYLLFADLGLEGERGELWYGKRESCLAYRANPVTEYWDIFEIVDTPDGGKFWMYQDIYRLRLPELAMPLARALGETAVFPRYSSEFQPIHIPGLDAAWVYNDLEAVAVKGELVAHLEYLSGGTGELDHAAVLTALAERWAEGGTFLP